MQVRQDNYWLQCPVSDFWFISTENYNGAQTIQKNRVIHKREEGCDHPDVVILPFFTNNMVRVSTTIYSGPFCFLMVKHDIFWNYIFWWKEKKRPEFKTKEGVIFKKKKREKPKLKQTLGAVKPIGWTYTIRPDCCMQSNILSFRVNDSGY